ncbi:hypothetical protein EDC27_0158 [Desulfosoma caldarium]|uniref:Uncharacterized protein n=1 Tax=Desulfosoma caldarium TaxID=610254 RepID=A0A3N1VJC0_9BACT|nr:hypothetical protein EDC27_0158 [Desulfosoma caldarium]
MDEEEQAMLSRSLRRMCQPPGGDSTTKGVKEDGGAKLFEKGHRRGTDSARGRRSFRGEDGVPLGLVAQAAGGSRPAGCGDDQKP